MVVIHVLLSLADQSASGKKHKGSNISHKRCVLLYTCRESVPLANAYAR